MAVRERTVGKAYQKLAHLSPAERGAVLATEPLSLTGESRSQIAKSPVSLKEGISPLNQPRMALNDPADDTQMPWVIRILTGTMTYAFENKVGMLVFISVLLGIFWMAGCIGKR